MKTHQIGDINYLSYESFAASRNVTNIVTTRLGGRSTGPYATMNLSFNAGEDAHTVLENRAIMAQVIGSEPEHLTVGGQVHASDVAVITSQDRGRGAITHDDAVEGADAMVTRATNLPLMVLIADCVAVSFYDPATNAIGLAHAGWRGTLGRIASKTLATMSKEFGTSARDVTVGISPSIGRGHFEVGEEVMTAFKKEFGHSARNFVEEDMHGTCYVDLWAANEAQLIEAGVTPDHLEISEMCTACHLDLFYSHRHEDGNTGRFAAIMMLHASGDRLY